MLKRMCCYAKCSEDFIQSSPACQASDGSTRHNTQECLAKSDSPLLHPVVASKTETVLLFVPVVLRSNILVRFWIRILLATHYRVAASKPTSSIQTGRYDGTRTRLGLLDKQVYSPEYYVSI